MERPFKDSQNRFQNFYRNQLLKSFEISSKTFQEKFLLFQFILEKLFNFLARHLVPKIIDVQNHVTLTPVMLQTPFFTILQ